jgi:hypothetical protein
LEFQNTKDIEKAMMKVLKKNINKPSKKQLDMCKEKSRQIYSASLGRSEEEIQAMIESESEDIIWGDF